MKVIERVMEKIIRERVFIHDMQFGFMPAWRTTDAIFILKQLHEKSLAKNRKLYFAFVDLEKVFDRVPRKIIWWPYENLALRSGLCSLYRLCTTTPGVKLESVTPTMMNLELKLDFIRIQYLPVSYSSLNLKLCHVSSAPGHPGSCCMLMT